VPVDENVDLFRSITEPLAIHFGDRLTVLIEEDQSILAAIKLRAKQLSLHFTYPSDEHALRTE
jgi:hypothetical protein